MKYQPPVWWRRVADAARQRDRASALSCVPRGETFDPIGYAVLDRIFWQTVEEAHSRGQAPFPTEGHWLDRIGFSFYDLPWKP